MIGTHNPIGLKSKEIRGKKVEKEGARQQGYEKKKKKKVTLPSRVQGVTDHPLTPKGW
jgi:hypothetical protein